MLRIHSLELDQKLTTAIVVNWEIEGTPEDLNLYRFSVYRCFAPSTTLADYDLLASGINPNNVSYYADSDIMTVSDKILNLYYMIGISGIAGQGVSYSDPIKTMYKNFDKYAREIVRRRNVIFQHHSGTPTYVYIRKKTGTFCPVCFDQELMRTTISDCTTCYGTGYVGGYYTPIYVKSQLSQQPVREMFQMFGGWQDQDGVLYMQAHPLLAPKDFVYVNDRRWIVLNIGNYAKSDNNIGQTAHVRQVERGDIINQVPMTGEDINTY
jgi:hypothetical protein